jgi:hypothetical protein
MRLRVHHGKSAKERTMLKAFARKFALPKAALVAVMLVPAGAMGADTNNAPTFSFEPEVERVLDGRGILGARVYLDFEQGLVTVERLAEDPERNRRLHRDLKLDLTPGSEEWTGIDLQVAPASEDMWGAPADRMIAALADNLAPPLATMQVTPGLWFFKTGEGRYGLMRVIGLVEPHPGDKAMKIVYKLAIATRMEGAQTNSSK